MRTQRRVFEKLSETTKVELASEKIELSLLSDLAKSDDEIKSFIKKYEKIVVEAEKAQQLLKEAKKMNDKGYSLSSANLKIGRKFVQEFKELGVPLSELKNVKGFMDNTKTRGKLDDLNSRLLKALPR
jgi:hypothetical protein